MITQPAVNQNLAQVCLFVERTRPKTAWLPFILNPTHKQIIPIIIAKMNIGIENIRIPKLSKNTKGFMEKNKAELINYK